MSVLLQLLPAAGQLFLQPVIFFFFFLSGWLCTSLALSLCCAAKKTNKNKKNQRLSQAKQMFYLSTVSV